MIEFDTPARGAFVKVLGVAALAAAFFLVSPSDNAAFAQTEALDEDLVNPYENDPVAIAYGNKRFGRRCAYCHGGGGRGAKGPDLTDDKWKHGGSNANLLQNIIGGIPMTQMGGFGAWMDGDEIMKIMAYMRDENRKRHESGELPVKKKKRR
jgi:mono/diheme cytochrome c family protein